MNRYLTLGVTLVVGIGIGAAVVQALHAQSKPLGEVMHDGRGAWHISNFTKHVKSQSVTAQRTACDAARTVLQSHFPGEGEFLTSSRRD